MPVRQLVAALAVVVVLAGCDSAEGDVRPVFSDLIVTMTGPDEIVIETETEYGLPFTLRVDRERIPTGLRLRVVGAEPTDRSELLPQVTGYGVGRVRVGLPEGEHAVEVVHLGATDVYALTLASRAYRLSPVRTSVSRLGPRDRPLYDSVQGTEAFGSPALSPSASWGQRDAVVNDAERPRDLAGRP